MGFGETKLSRVIFSCSAKREDKKGINGSPPGKNSECRGFKPKIRAGSAAKFTIAIFAVNFPAENRLAQKAEFVVGIFVCVCVFLGKYFFALLR